MTFLAWFLIWSIMVAAVGVIAISTLALVFQTQDTKRASADLAAKRRKGP